MIKCEALVAQWKSGRLLTGGLQVQVLPGALTVATARESEDEMERLISLFREPDYDESPALEHEQRPPPQAEEEPLYFRQLLEYLRERKESASASADELIGV